MLIMIVITLYLKEPRQIMYGDVIKQKGRWKYRCRCIYICNWWTGDVAAVGVGAEATMLKKLLKEIVFCFYNTEIYFYLHVTPTYIQYFITAL